MSLIGKRIGDLKMTQAELARRLAVSPQAVHEWVHRRRTPRPHMMKKLAHELQVGVESVLADFCH